MKAVKVGTAVDHPSGIKRTNEIEALADFCSIWRGQENWRCGFI